MGTASSLIEMIYRGMALEPAARGAMVSAIGSHFGAPDAHLVVRDGQGRLCASLATGPLTVAGSARAARFKEWTVGMASNAFGPAVLGRTAVEALADGVRIANDHLGGPEPLHVLGAVVPASGHVVSLGLGRPGEAEAFTRAERMTLSDMLPHLRQAVDMAARYRLFDEHVLAQTELFAAVSGAAMATLDAMGVGFALVDASGEVRHLSACGERFLRAQDVVRLIGGRLRLAEAGRQARLLTLLADVIATGRGGGLVPLPGRCEAQALAVAPVPQAVMPTRHAPLALVLFGGAQVGEMAVPALMELYGLTRSEALLLQGLTEGQTIQSYAQAMGIGVETVRTHLKHIYGKTGHDRQADLVRAVLSNPLIGLSSAFSL